uniref:Peptidase S1 domain-containing protein n=1 Tax=Glossina pallidipes TaxID=7398 RepID=A0A1A9Z6G2_GLOPL
MEILQQRERISSQDACFEDPIEYEKDTELAKHIVWYRWPSNDESLNIANGIIISANVILTYNYHEVTKNKMGSIVHGEREYRSKILREKIIYWQNGRNYQNNIVGKPSEVHIGLVRLNSEIELMYRNSEIVSLPRKSFSGESDCVVVGQGGARAREIVETPATILTRDDCLKSLPDVHENAICIDYKKNKNIYTCDTGQCEHFKEGAALFCDGTLTGIVNEVKPCDSSLPRPCTKVYEHVKWINSEMKELEKTILHSKYAQHLVYYGWYVNNLPAISGLGSILDKNIILTHFAPDLSNSSIIVRKSNNGVIRDGYAVYGLKKYDKTPPGGSVLTWRIVKNFLIVTKPDPLQIQIGIIKVDGPMILESGKAAIMELPKQEPESKLKCIVVHIGKVENEPIVETEVTIVEKSKCLEQLPGLHSHAFCFHISDDSDEINHCTIFITGAPILCNDQLTCIVNDPGQCMPDLPRACTLVYKFYEWIKRFFAIITCFHQTFDDTTIDRVAIGSITFRRNCRIGRQYGILGNYDSYLPSHLLRNLAMNQNDTSGETSHALKTN